MHCPPSYHNLETEIGKSMGERFGRTETEVFEWGRSIVFDDAKNLIHTIKSIIAAAL